MPLEILPYPTLPASYGEYDPRVADAAAALLDHLGSEGQIRAEHVGSTSVPGLGGKGILDLLVVFETAEDRERIKRELARLGFQPQKSRDPFPEDRPMRVGAMEWAGQRYRIHVHVVPADSTEPEELRRFRDELRHDPAMRDAYVAEKARILAAGLTDSLDYAVAKGEFVQAALRRLGFAERG